MRIARLVALGAVLGGLLFANAPVGAGTSSGAPEPTESIKATVKKLKRALKSTSCQARGQVLRHSSGRVDPAAPSVPVVPSTPFTTTECADIAAFAAQVHDFKPKRSMEYGTGALIEGTLDGEPYAMTFVLDVDGKWRAIAAGTMARQIGTSPTLDFGTSASAFVTAVASGDCLASWAYLTADSPYVTSRFNAGGSVKWCADVAASLSTGSGRLFDLIAAPAAPEELGSTLHTAFYGIELPSGRYVTLVLFSQLGGITDHLDPGVFDYVTSRAPSPSVTTTTTPP